MPQVTYRATVNIEVWCGTCGAPLCGQTDVAEGPHVDEVTVHVEACTRCVDKARDEGIQEGQEGA